MKVDSKQFAAISDYFIDELKKIPRDIAHINLMLNPSDEPNETGETSSSVNGHPVELSLLLCLEAEKREEFLEMLVVSVMCVHHEDEKCRKKINEILARRGYSLQRTGPDMNNPLEMLMQALKGIGAQPVHVRPPDDLKKYNIEPNPTGEPFDKIVEDIQHRIANIPRNGENTILFIASKKEEGSVFSRNALIGNGKIIIDGGIAAMEALDNLAGLMQLMVINYLQRNPKQIKGFLEELGQH